MGISEPTYLSIPTHNVCLAPVLINLRPACAVNRRFSMGINAVAYLSIPAPNM